MIHILKQACGALGEAHARGLIHRDVKPGNVFLCRERGEPDAVKMLDFGVVKDLKQVSDLNATSEQGFIGTPRYLSPESVSTPATLDGRSDLYSLGAVGYFLLCGEPLFVASTMLEACAQHLYSVPVPPSQRLGRPVPPDLETVILRCLEKSRDSRPLTAAALAAALAGCADADPWTADHARAWWRDKQRRDRGPARRACRWGAGRSPAGLQTVAVDRANRAR